MKRVKEILDSKGYDVWTIAPDESVLAAIKLMAERGIGALVVSDDENGDGHVVGIVTERDYARKVILQGRSSRETPIAAIMTSPVICTYPERTAEECMAIMTEKRVRHLPVMDEDKLVGMISIGDLVKSIIDHQQFLIEQLESYITS
jgi:CBS domain-containing protein